LGRATDGRSRVKKEKDYDVLFFYGPSDFWTTLGDINLVADQAFVYFGCRRELDFAPFGLDIPALDLVDVSYHLP
jgi:hypothetical protein